MVWTCWKCQRGDVPHNRRSDLCTGCHAALRAEGKRWCPHCRTVRPMTHFAAASVCRDCTPAYFAARRGTQPLAGHVPIPAAAAALGYTAHVLRKRCRLGLVPGAKRLPGRKAWWIPESALR